MIATQNLTESLFTCFTLLFLFTLILRSLIRGERVLRMPGIVVLALPRSHFFFDNFFYEATYL